MKPSVFRKINHPKYQDMFAFFSLIVVAVFLCLLAPHGFGVMDESFHLTIPLRLINGDSLLTDEWGVQQLSAVLLYLPVKFYISIVGSTEGIILFFRYLFIGFQVFVSAVTYSRLRKYGQVSIIAALVFCLHIPLLIMSLSYYSMGLGFVQLTGVLMATTKKYTKATFCLTGVFFACAVLCNPILTFVYLLYTICVIYYETTKNKKHQFANLPEISFSLKTWLLITLGVVATAIMFFIFLFSRTSFHEIAENFPNLFNDPGYQYFSWDMHRPSYSVFKDGSIMNAFGFITSIISFKPYLFACYALLMALLTFDKNRMAHREIYLICFVVVFFVYTTFIISSVRLYDYAFWAFPLSLLGLSSFVLSKKKNRDIFVFLWVLGFLYAVCLDISSDVGYIAACIGLTVSNVASVIFIGNVVKELLEKDYNYTVCKNDIQKMKRFWSGSIAILLTIALLFQLYQEYYILTDFDTTRFESRYEELRGEKIDTTITIGPEKGLKTTSGLAKRYNCIIQDFSLINDSSEGPVLILGLLPWLYLYLNMPYATYSTWYNDFDLEDTMPRLMEYYKLHPEKSPKIIYIPKTNNNERSKDMLIDVCNNYNFNVKSVSTSNVGYMIKICK